MDAIKRPLLAKVIGCKWVFAFKVNNDEIITRFKTRIVAQGLNQVYSVNYIDTTRPVIEKKSVKLLVYLAVDYEWNLVI